MPDLPNLIQRAIQAEIEKIVAEEAEAAAKRTEARVKSMTAQIAATVCQRMSMELYDGNHLKIIVEFKP